jgi:hypothetical protein
MTITTGFLAQQESVQMKTESHKNPRFQSDHVYVAYNGRKAIRMPESKTWVSIDLFMSVHDLPYVILEELRLADMQDTLIQTEIVAYDPSNDQMTGNAVKMEAGQKVKFIVNHQ